LHVYSGFERRLEPNHIAVRLYYQNEVYVRFSL